MPPKEGSIPVGAGAVFTPAMMLKPLWVAANRDHGLTVIISSLSCDPSKSASGNPSVIKPSAVCNTDQLASIF